MAEVLDLFEGLTPDQARKFRQEAIKRLNDLRVEIENNNLAKGKKMTEKEIVELRKKIAINKGLPGVFAEWLRGESEEDIEKDADRLIRFVNPEIAILNINRMTPAEIRANAKQLLEKAVKEGMEYD